MKSTCLIGIIMFFIVSCNPRPETKQKLNALLITGGHAFDTTAFFDLFESLRDIEVDTISQPAANHFLATGNLGNIDVFVFYDMWNDISEEEKNAYYAYAEEGKGFVFLHHSLVSYQDWDEFMQFRGGKYVQNDPDTARNSDYRHDIEMDVKVVDPDHPVLKGISDFTIVDEGYSNIRISSQIHPLLATDHPDAAEYLAWTNKFRNSRIVYIMLGHDKKAWENENFSRLIHNAIQWTADK